LEKTKLDRISELTAIARERELTADETRERGELRQEYLAEWRKGTIEALQARGAAGAGE
jgi:uncharacterized protein YnzC (UPF0291/DUF896 family)